MNTPLPNPIPPVHQCTCAACSTQTATPLTRYHSQINLLLSRLNEPQRRWYVGSLSLAPEALTDGELSRITGLDEKTIRCGRRELQADLSTVPTDRLRHEGGGQPAAEKKTRP